MSAEPKAPDAQYIIGQDLSIPIDRKPSVAQDVAQTHEAGLLPDGLPEEDYEGKPTHEELYTLRRVAGKLPTIAFLMCAVEFAERASYYGVQPLIGNFVKRPLPSGGLGTGAPNPNPGPGTSANAGALNLGSSVASAVSTSFSMLAYILPLFFGYLADTRTGRFRMICYGVLVFGVSHVLMIGAAAPSLLQSGNAIAPYMISVYILAIGAAMFKPCVSPLLLDQVKTVVPVVRELPSGERVIDDPEATAERVMLWFYLLINVGGFMNVPTAYSAKYVGYWLAFLIPLFLYLPLPALLWYMKKRLVLYPPGGNDLFNVFRVLTCCFRRGGIIGRKGFWDRAKPSVIAQSSNPITVSWNDAFVDDVRRTFQATGIFCFFPIQFINDNGLGLSANVQSNMMETQGVPNDVFNNINPFAIIIMAPLLNYLFYPTLRKYKIHYGPIARITTGLFLSSCAGVGYTVLNYYCYKLSPCGSYGSSNDCVDDDGNQLVAPFTIWYSAIPIGIGGISELFINVPAYAIAYSRAPKNMRGLVSALNLFNTGVAYIIGLACSAAIQDPYLTWDFGGPAIAGFICTVVFWFLFKHIDEEEYRLSTNGDYHMDESSGLYIPAAETGHGSSLDEKTTAITPDSHRVRDEEIGH